MQKVAEPERVDSANTAADCAVCGAALRGKPAVQLGRACMRTCGVCGSWTYLPRVSAAEQAAIHDNDDYFEHPYFMVRREASPAQRRRCRDVFECLAPALDAAALRGEPILDIGCDTGVFLQGAQEEFGILPIGVDVCRRSVDAARQHGVQAYRATIETAPAELTGLQLITAIDVIEHVSDPGAFLREIRRRLRPGGLVYLETPNIRSVVYRFGGALAALTGGRPAGLIERLFPPQHIQYFTRESLQSLAAGVGLEVVRLRARVLPVAHISASLAALSAITLLQACDRLLGTQILLCAALRRPLES